MDFSLSAEARKSARIHVFDGHWRFIGGVRSAPEVCFTVWRIEDILPKTLFIPICLSHPKFTWHRPFKGGAVAVCH
jgi:hypothetical protein